MGDVPYPLPLNAHENNKYLFLKMFCDIILNGNFKISSKESFQTKKGAEFVGWLEQVSGKIEETDPGLARCDAVTGCREIRQK